MGGSADTSNTVPASEKNARIQTKQPHDKLVMPFQTTLPRSPAQGPFVFADCRTFVPEHQTCLRLAFRWCLRAEYLRPAYHEQARPYILTHPGRRRRSQTAGDCSLMVQRDCWMISAALQAQYHLRKIPSYGNCPFCVASTPCQL